MKLFKYELGDWENHEGNLYRSGISIGEGKLMIGLVRHMLAGKIVHWTMDVVVGFNNNIRETIEQYMDTWYPQKLYLKNELEQGKQDIDHLITKLNNLKLFI